MITSPEPEKPAVQHELPAVLLHDLRTPLGHILGYSELLIEMLKPEGNEEVVRYAEKIRAAGRAMLALMNERLQAK